MQKQKIIIDTDPGVDDAVAILLALASPEVEVLGISCAAGVVGVETTTTNALRLLEIVDRPDIPVFRGCPKPILQPHEMATIVHGEYGIGKIELPQPSIKPQKQHAVDWMIDSIMSAAEDEITLCTLAPLTNVACAFIKEPRIIHKLREIIIMGGGYFRPGNSFPAGEFNFKNDPEAAQIVMQSGAKSIKLFPLDLSHKALTLEPRLEALRNIGPIGRMTASWLAHYRKFDIARYDEPGGPVHDANVIASVIKPELYETRHVYVEIDLGSPITRGMSVMDWWNVTDTLRENRNKANQFTYRDWWPHAKAEPNCHVAHSVDDDGFYTLLNERLGQLKINPTYNLPEELLK